MFLYNGNAAVSPVNMNEIWKTANSEDSLRLLEEQLYGYYLNGIRSMQENVSVDEAQVRAMIRRKITLSVYKEVSKELNSEVRVQLRHYRMERLKSKIKKVIDFLIDSGAVKLVVEIVKNIASKDKLKAYNGAHMSTVV